jgi:hypothetical protein
MLRADLADKKAQGEDLSRLVAPAQREVRTFTKQQLVPLCNQLPAHEGADLQLIDVIEGMNKERAGWYTQWLHGQSSRGKAGASGRQGKHGEPGQDSDYPGKSGQGGKRGGNGGTGGDGHPGTIHQHPLPGPDAILHINRVKGKSKSVSISGELTFKESHLTNSTKAYDGLEGQGGKELKFSAEVADTAYIMLGCQGGNGADGGRGGDPGKGGNGGGGGRGGAGGPGSIFALEVENRIELKGGEEVKMDMSGVTVPGSGEGGSQRLSGAASFRMPSTAGVMKAITIATNVSDHQMNIICFYRMPNSLLCCLGFFVITIGCWWQRR